MTSENFSTLLPLMVLAATPIVIMISIAIQRNHAISGVLALLGLLLAFISLAYPLLVPPAARHIPPLLSMDTYSVFYIGLMIAASFVLTALSHGYLEYYEGRKEEFYILIILGTLGSSVLVASTHFMSFFLGLEILSVSLYTMIGYVRENEQCVEAGIKYLVLAAASSAFLLFGMALVYAELGSMAFPEIARRLGAPGLNTMLILTGFSLIIVGIGFKLGVVPFHMWTPDVYQGAPAPVSGFIASVSKGGMVGLLFRLFLEYHITQYSSILLVFSIIAIASMFIGNFLALLQDNVKRIMAYSSIAHFGYILVAFLAAGNMGIEAGAFYLTAYFVTIIGAFGTITILSGKEREAEEIEDYRGLYWRHPWIASIFTVFMFSLAGIPLTAGFIGKFYLVAAGVNSSLWYLVIILVINSALGLYYYLKIIVYMYLEHTTEAESTEKAAPLPPSVSVVSGFVLVLVIFFLIWFGVYPQNLMVIIKSAIAGFGYAPMITAGLIP